MRFYHSATALALLTTVSFAQQCPPGYQRSRKLDWKFCGQGIADSTLECATIEVPRDWNNAATSDKLALQLIRQPAKNPNAKSIIINPGGPGESGIEIIISGNSGLQQTFGDFHIVSFDPRGVGLTMPYKDCKAADSSKWKDPVAETDDQATFDYKAAKAWSDACAAENKEWGTLIGTAYVARDIMAIFEALKAAGEDGLIRYAGYSYGTLLGATLTAMFPEKVARVLLDGNINPTDYYRGDGIEAGTDVTKGIENFFAQCADAGKDNCALADKDQSAQVLLTQYNELLDKLSKTDRSKNYIVRGEFFQVLYFKKPTAFKDFAIDLKAWITDPASVKKRSNKRDDFQANKWQKLEQNSAIMGITCGDRIVKDGSPAKYNQLKEAYQQKLGANYDLAMAGSFECTVWEQNAAERFMGSFSDIKTEHPILIVNTPWDPVTPAVSAEASRKAFRGSKLVMSNGVGHCSSAHDNPDLNKAIKKYFMDGDLPNQSEFKIPDNNVFRKVPEPPTVVVDETGVPVSKRDVRLPDYFQKREDGVPADCTKIPVSDSALASASASVAPLASASLSGSMSAPVSASQSAESTSVASPSVSASASESFILSQSEPASASILALPSASASNSRKPTPGSVSASPVVTPSVSASHSESASIMATGLSVAASASLSELPVLTQTVSASASVSVKKFSESLQASIRPTASQSELSAVSLTPSAPALSESASLSMAYISSSVDYSVASASASASVASEQGSQLSSVAISASVSAEMSSSSTIGFASASFSIFMDHAMTASSIAQPSSHPADPLTSSAFSTSVYTQGTASVTTSTTYPAVSSVEHFSSSDLYPSTDVRIPHPAPSYSLSVSSTSAHVDVSSSTYPDTFLSPTSNPASLLYSSPSLGSINVHSQSSTAEPYASSSIVYPETSAYPSGSSIMIGSHSSQYSSGSSMIDYTSSSVTGAPSTGSYYPVSTLTYSFEQPTLSISSKTKPVHNHSPTSKSSTSPTSAKSIESKYIYSNSVPAYSSSVALYATAGNQAYPTEFFRITTSIKSQGPKTTLAPCITVPWSSQSGYVPITKTYTTTSVRAMTKCPDTVKECPLDSSTKTYITTELKTRTTVVAIPSAPAGNKSYLQNKESDDKSSAPPSRETGKVPSLPKDSDYANQPATDIGKGGQPAKETKLSTSQPAKSTGYFWPPKESKSIQSVNSAYAPPEISSTPSISTSAPPYPTGPSTPSSIKVCSDMKCTYISVPTGTKPVVGTGTATTLKTSAPSMNVCVGKECKATGTPTGYKPAQFTGAASRDLVGSMLGAGAMIVAFARFF